MVISTLGKVSFIPMIFYSLGNFETNIVLWRFQPGWKFWRIFKTLGDLFDAILIWFWWVFDPDVMCIWSGFNEHLIRFLWVFDPILLSIWSVFHIIGTFSSLSPGETGETIFCTVFSQVYFHQCQPTSKVVKLSIKLELTLYALRSVFVKTRIHFLKSIQKWWTNVFLFCQKQKCPFFCFLVRIVFF